MGNQRNYKGIWIPREIWEHDQLSATEKVLFADIASMLDDGLEFFKSNTRIALDLKCSDSTAKRAIASLKKNELIEAHQRGRRRLILLGTLGKMIFDKGHFGANGGQSDPAHGSKRTRSNTVSESLMIQIENANLDIEDFYGFEEESDIQDLINQWADHREECSKPLTAKQRDMFLVNLFVVSKGDSDDAALCVEQAIMGGWSRFFPPRHDEEWT